jgi:hypothetical protein
MLAFGSFTGDDDASVAIGRTVCEVLGRHGLTVEWDGSASQRIRIPPFEWQKRRFTLTPGHDLLLIACALEHRMAVLEACRSVLKLDLATAKAGLDSLEPRTFRWDTRPPWVVMRGLSRADADRFAAALADAGAEVEVR